VPITLDVIEPLFHMWTLWPDALPQARKTVERITAFLEHTK